MKHTNQEVLDETVRRRLAALIEDVPARRAAPEETGPSGPPAGQAVPLVERSGSPAEPDDDLPVVVRAADIGGVDVAEAPPREWYDPVEPDEEATVLGRGKAVALKAWAFGRQHATVIGIVVLGACLWAGYTAAQARSTQVSPPAAVSVTSPTATPGGLASSAPASSAPVAPIRVHVIGGVATPGVVEVPADARVGDVIKAAGGVSKDGDPGELNLAAPAVDGSQIVVGTKAKPRGEVRLSGTDAVAGSSGGGSSGSGTSSSTSASATSAQVSLNTATAAELETLPGVGPVTAQKILAWRDEHQKFTNIAELQEVSGIGAKTYAQIAPHVRL